jgi:hypothetical protein
MKIRMLTDWKRFVCGNVYEPTDGVAEILLTLGKAERLPDAEPQPKTLTAPANKAGVKGQPVKRKRPSRAKPEAEATAPDAD